ncbi:phage infection protein, partial [Leptolyngbya cf. ectocarpi LEGE 11479]
QLNKVSKIKKDEIESCILKDLECSDIFSAVRTLKDNNYGSLEYAGIEYKKIFDPKVVELLNEESVRTNISDYCDRYNDLVESSPLFKKGKFNPINANSVSKNLKKEQFFQASHKVLLNGKDEVVVSWNELDRIFEEEKQKIFEDENLQEISNKIISGVAAVKTFQGLLEEFPAISSSLADIDEFKKILWGSYFEKYRSIFDELLELHDNNKDELIAIENEARLEETAWYEAHAVFKERFHVPFSMDIKNHKNAILGTTSPNIVFSFKSENESEIKFDRGQLKNLDFLSVGERRAMYLLYVIFEFKARLESGRETVILIDDIADSFDYKNKYAIIEYLKELAQEETFRIIVLTHNFDFYRTFQSRILGSAKWRNSFIAKKDDECINLLKGGNRGVRSPFDLWRNNYFKDEAILISMIPFVRNLVEYKDGTSCEDYEKLTSMLHIKSDTRNLKLSDLEFLIHKTISAKSLDAAFDRNCLVIDQIYQAADSLCTDEIENEIRLEKKVTLSIATRLKAEEFMWLHVIDKSPINNMQTGKLFDRLVQEKKSADQEFTHIKKILSQVILMTPENIHINSFMYEPLMDMSNHHLVTLYQQIKSLSTVESLTTSDCTNVNPLAI